MSRTVKIVLGAFITLFVVSALLFATGIAQQWLFMYFVSSNGPDHEFEPSLAVDAPDYADRQFWAALPSMDDPADLVPQGVVREFEQGDSPVDVFFVHPTGYLSGATWHSPMDPDSAAEENTNWMLAYQASAYNGCCNVYAPRYREATIYTYFQDEDVRERILGFAYADVERAFDHFLANYSEGRPFILASHSQGSHHLKRLLAERIDGTELYSRMVAAYPIGSVMIAWSEAYFAGMQDVKPCLSATQTGCVVHWDTWAEGGSGVEREEDSLCTNPLTWAVNGDRAPASENIGAVPVTIPYNISLDIDNAPRGVTFTALEAPVPNHTWAQCRDGTLFVADQSGGPISEGPPGGNYHGLDYALFYMDIRQNAKDRVAAYLNANTVSPSS